MSPWSCTMKLNAAAEMMPVSWRVRAITHFAPLDQVAGYRQLFQDLGVAGRNHGPRRRLAAAECRRPGRVHRPAGDPGVSPE
jgi:hypothetical protein